jgi:hypothetical protein
MTIQIIADVKYGCGYNSVSPYAFITCTEKFTLTVKTVQTENTESLFLLRRHLGNWPRGPSVSIRSELLVAHEKLGQLPLLTVYVLPV